MARNYLNSTLGSSNTGLYFQLELKGLGRLGNSVGDVLQRGILGYQDQ